MLGLPSEIPRNPLEPTITGSFEGDGFMVDMLHFQSRPGLYVTGNLYRPEQTSDSKRLPTVLYVCGHSNQGRNGNKAAYQSHGIWFARHGYVCLMIDTLQLGEIAAIHHGTYREERWWWHSRGYTSAGVECLNGIRAIDYLVTRNDVDSERIAVTGISGGGAATFWIAAADPRVHVAVPVSGMGDLPSYIPNRVINGHCDCMFLHNTFQWPWTRIAGLIAPRPLLFVNSDSDAIFPMDANQRVINRLEMLYRLYGAGDRVDSVVSGGGHAYREDIRQSAYRFLNSHLKDDPRIVEDGEVDLVVGTGSSKVFPLDPESLRVFPKDEDIPKDELNTTIDELFVPMADLAPPELGEFEEWKLRVQSELSRVTFTYFPETIPPAEFVEDAGEHSVWLATEEGIKVPLRRLISSETTDAPQRILLIIADEDLSDSSESWVSDITFPGDLVYELSPRGVGPTRWTQKNPPNYVERSHALLGRTVDTGRVWDIIAAAQYLHAEHDGVTLVVGGGNAAGVLAAYAAERSPGISGVILHNPPPTHMEPSAPQLLNVLRVCDIPDVLGLIAPRSVTIHGTISEEASEAFSKTATIFDVTNHPEHFRIIAN
jgi:dienelactone hydrolase